MISTPDWEAYLERSFPGYLLPQSARTTLSCEAAERVLQRLGARPGDLQLVVGAGMVARWGRELRELVEDELPDFVRMLPRRTQIVRRDWRGGFRGRLDVAPTVLLHAQGQPDRFITRDRRRDFNRPESVLVAETARRLVRLLTGLRGLGVMGSSGAASEGTWWATAAHLELPLQHLLTHSRLREVACEPLTSLHERAAGRARHRACRLALKWHRRFIGLLDQPSTKRLVRHLEETGLVPLDAPTRFEVAVLMRLVEGIGAHLEHVSPGSWSCTMGLLTSGRSDVACFEGSAGGRVSVYYDQSALKSQAGAGPRQLLVRKYLGTGAAPRPDITVFVEPEGDATPWAFAVEVKLSDNVHYLAQGLTEAFAYVREYPRLMWRSPKAALVAPGRIETAVCVEDEVVAEAWERWPSDELLCAVLDFDRTPAGPAIIG